MFELGIRYVRLAEFAWSRLEPSPRQYDFAWLDKVIEILHEAGLKVILCTPTATPPKWLVDELPQMISVDPATGRRRGFGSRRHYDFSCDEYLERSLEFCDHFIRHYADHLAVVGWQTDNEIGCHDTTLSASELARAKFQQWCEQRYDDIQQLNQLWGNVFWSMEYRSYSEIELPVGAVTETNPSHLLAWRRCSSDQVLNFHNRYVALLKKLAPKHFVTHNFIPMDDTEVDNQALAKPLDFASYDNYPLGRSDQFFVDAPASDYRRYMRTGHPDFATYYFDQVRGLKQKGFWVMEQQPGPVNWADNNPWPAPGMVRLWTMEAFAHGAECVSYFRWRQASFAQEQMHAGLLRPDQSRSLVWPEIQRAISEAHSLEINLLEQPTSQIAIVTSPESYWVSDIEQQSASYSFNKIQFDYYRAARELGLNVDFVYPDADLSSYQLVLVPGLPVVNDEFIDRCQQTGATIVFGPRSGAKTEEFTYPTSLPPGPLQSLIPVKVLSIETLRRDCSEPFQWQSKTYQSTTWREWLDPGESTVEIRGEDSIPLLLKHGRFRYLATLTNLEFLKDYLSAVCAELSITMTDLANDVRVQRRGNLVFAFNYSDQERALTVPENTLFLIGSQTIKPRDISVWKLVDS